MLGCLEASGGINAAVAREGDSILTVAGRVADSLEQTSAGSDAGFWKAGYLRLAGQRLADYYAGGLLDDSARVNRLIDHVAVTLEFTRGELTPTGEQYYPKRTPYLTWIFYGGIGIFLQPLTSVEHVVGIPLPDPAASTDSLIHVADALWAQANWRTGRYGRFPVWEYNFPARTNFLELRAPWISGMAQGEILKIFAEVYRRTQAATWRERGDLILNSLRTTWSEGGVLVDDTTHGYWWEEADPHAMIWNGAMATLVAVGVYADATGEPDAARMYQRGLEAARYWTPFYDDGHWTRYCLLSGYVVLPYHQWHIRLADALYTQTGDTLWRGYADRWRAYPVPPELAPSALSPNGVALAGLLDPHSEPLGPPAR